MSYSTLPRAFQSCAYKYANRPFLLTRQPETEGWVSNTWDDVALEVHRLGSGLLAESIEIGDRVGLWARNCAEWVNLDLAILSIGAVSVPIPVTLSHGQVNEVVRQHGIRWMVVDNWNDWELIQSWPKQGLPLRSVVVIAPKANFSHVELGALSCEDLIKNGMTMSPQSFIDRLTATDPEHPATVMELEKALSHEELYQHVSALAGSLSLAEGDLHLSQVPLSSTLERIGLYTLMFLGGRIAYPSSATTSFDLFKQLDPSMTIALPEHLQQLKGELEATVNNRNPVARHMFKKMVSRPATSGISSSIKNRWLLEPTRQHLGKNLRLILCEPTRLSGEDLYFFQNLGIAIESRDPLHLP